jgi:hypothetical protein
MGDKGSKHSGIQYRKVSTQIYADARFAALSSPKANGKTLWLYLLTGPHTTNIPGLFAVSRETLASNLGWSVKDVTRIWKEFEAVDEGHEYRMVMADWSKNLVFVPKAVAHNGVGSFNAVQGWRAQWNNLVECELKLEAWEAILAGFQAAGNDECAAAFAVCCKRPNLKYTGAFPSRIDGSRHWLNPLFFSQRVVEALGGRGGTIPPTILGSLPPGILPHPVGEPPRDQDQDQEQEQEQDQEQEQEKKKEPSPPPAGAGAITGPARPSFATETQPTTQPAAAPARLTPAVDATGQASLLPATGKPDRRRKPAGEPEDEPTATADLDRWVARYVDLKRPPFPPALTKEDRIFFFQQRKARGIDELVWVLETLHGDSYSAHLPIRALVAPEAAQKAAGLKAKATQEPAFRSNKFAQSHEQLDDVWQQP